jgi:CheY-like chemotaxis protein
MEPITVLVIEEGAEAALVCAALAKKPEVRVVDAPDVARALKRLKTGQQQVAVAIVGASGLARSADLVKKLQPRGIPIIGLVHDLAPAAKQRALAAGVREIHERPTRWQPYSELIDSLISRFITPN